MFKYFISGIFGLAVAAATTTNLQAASYSKKASYSGCGKTSKTNGLPKYKTTSGHMKKTSKGYTYVNPYCRSR